MLKSLELYYAKLDAEYRQLGKPQTQGQWMHAKRVKQELSGVINAIANLKWIAEHSEYEPKGSASTFNPRLSTPGGMSGNLA